MTVALKIRHFRICISNCNRKTTVWTL